MSYSLSITLADQDASCGAPATDPVAVRCASGTKLYMYATPPAYTPVAGPCGTYTYGAVDPSYTSVLDVSGFELLKLASNTWVIENLPGDWGTSTFARLVGQLAIDIDGSGTGYGVPVDVVKNVMNLWLSTLRSTVNLNGVVSVDNRPLPGNGGSASFSLAGYNFLYTVYAANRDNSTYPLVYIQVGNPSGGPAVPLTIMTELVPTGEFIQCATESCTAYGTSGSPAATAGLVVDGVYHSTQTLSSGSNLFNAYNFEALGYVPSTSFGVGYSTRANFSLPNYMYYGLVIKANPT